MMGPGVSRWKITKGNIKVSECPAKLIGKVNKEGRPGWSWVAESQ